MIRKFDDIFHFFVPQPPSLAREASNTPLVGLATQKRHAPVAKQSQIVAGRFARTSLPLMFLPSCTYEFALDKQFFIRGAK